MKKEDILTKLREKNTKKFLQDCWIEHLSLFGSWARNQATENSDIDLLYTQKQDIVIWWNFFEIKEYISNLFGKDIDLVEKKYLNHRIKDLVLSEKIDIL